MCRPAGEKPIFTPLSKRNTNMLPCGRPAGNELKHRNFIKYSRGGFDAEGR